MGKLRDYLAGEQPYRQTLSPTRVGVSPPQGNPCVDDCGGMGDIITLPPPFYREIHPDIEDDGFTTEWGLSAPFHSATDTTGRQ